ncbi:anthranilate phosphoribosyltransferase [Adhaeribacter arboris]|uniref:Anthranilate phosphoribosyltransferase n=1 Tax=Adhaeribacter arboris TaxID=2072846 RepID=A0A2T2YN57_9BACT|nr:anthranilate phosphoribosyltransferase [Adhaeribacter arboris]PSR56926.1 anthranilate phosphoribosyltransferase [Adhaeribacter arboris]
MKEILLQLFEQKALTKEAAYQVLVDLGQGKFNQSEMAAFLTVFLMRNITVSELEGFRDALLELCIKPNLGTHEVIDMCGTGGDGKDTFNISTLASFVVAGAGYKVAKHGNFGVSSVCGSSNIMAHFGYQFTSDSDYLRRKMDEANICFLHAPAFHPAMSHVGPIRKQLGLKTFFNMLGPMVNPAMPHYQMVGVFNLELLRLYAYLYQQTDKHFMVVHALDGYDEISLTGAFKVVTENGEQILTPHKIGFKEVKQEELAGGKTVEESAKIFIDVLENRGTTAQANAVIANAAMGLYLMNEDFSIDEAVAAARESLESGKALESFKKLIA